MTERNGLIHFTSVHRRTDTRIRVKETATLKANLDEPVSLYVQDGQGDEHDDNTGVQVIDTAMPADGRLRRMLSGSWRMYCAVRRAKPRMVHFHDPELIPVGILLRLGGAKVIYDVHEDVPRQILEKYWLPAWLRRPISVFAEGVEWVAARLFDGIIAATPTIAARFPEHKTAIIQNFPILNELVTPEAIPYAERSKDFVYVGGITDIRGVRETLDAIAQLKTDEARLQLAGTFSPDALGEEARRHAAWSKVQLHGWVNREQVSRILGTARAGIVCFLPAPNHLNAQPNKMFEYMAAGLPVIASDFPLWRQIIEGANCGLLVDPEDPSAIAGAMQWILDNPAEAEAMGTRARTAIESTYNWEREADKLVDFYRVMLDLPRG